MFLSTVYKKSRNKFRDCLWQIATWTVHLARLTTVDASMMDTDDWTVYVEAEIATQLALDVLKLKTAKEKGALT